MCKYSSFFEFPLVIRSQCVFTSLIRISALNRKSRHYVTIPTPRAVPGRRAKAFRWRKVVPLATVTLRAEVRQLAHPSCLRPPRRVRVPNVNGWLNFGKKQAKRYLGQGNSGEGCLGYPRPYKWGLSDINNFKHVSSKTAVLLRSHQLAKYNLVSNHMYAL